MEKAKYAPVYLETYESGELEERIKKLEAILNDYV